MNFQTSGYTTTEMPQRAPAPATKIDDCTEIRKFFTLAGKDALPFADRKAPRLIEPRRITTATDTGA
ncbi:hypothetical protein SIL87_03750 [Acidiphilium acidophilum]|uniref:Uncharacterized protein n=1 Tax=Acidiphilium acidophilum TaxID=76588 RepID=A0AAW9DLJ8_ACIAO|nr:hypothetical protein [Acidiphilium acidophilum]